MSIDESLRACQHPGVMSRPGPAGRRAALAGGPEIWEVIGAFKAVREESPKLTGDSLLAELVEVTGLSRDQVQVALRYYAAYPEEIDERIAANHEESQRQERLWRAEHKLLGT
jgi:hypothetical protein